MCIEKKRHPARGCLFSCCFRLCLLSVAVAPVGSSLVPRASHHLGAACIPAAQHLAVEAVLGVDDVVELRG